MGPFSEREGVWLTPMSLAVVYLVFGSAWIVISDRAVVWLFGLSALTLQAQLAKGLLFVLGSGLFIFGLVTQRDRQLRQRERTISAERSEIRDLEADVQSTEELYELILDNIHDTVLLTDESGAFTYVCPNVNHIFGFSTETVRQMGTIDALLGEDFPISTLEGEQLVSNIEREIEDADGESHTVLVTARSIEIDRGAWLFSIRDITQRKKHEERFRAYVENSSDVITVVDNEGMIEYVSPSVRDVLGYEPESLVGTAALELVHPDDRDELIEAMEVMESRSVTTTASRQYRSAHADGSWLWTESRVTFRDDDQPEAYVINIRDVSDLREREGRLSVLDRVLRHNIRNKLNIVVGAAHRLEEDPDADVSSNVELIVDAAENLLGLSQKARNFDASIHRAGDDLAMIDLTECVGRVVDEKRAEYPRATIDASIPEAARIKAHESVELAIAEVLDNAIVHADREDPTVSVEMTAAGSMIDLTVRDDGPGIPKRDRQAIQAGIETPLDHGMSLGLWLVRWTVENSGGDLVIEDRDPTGTEITLRFPVATETAGEPDV